jgi:hypothetical protein
MRIAVATAPQANVPKPKTRAQSRRNFLLARDSTGASVIGLTECFALSTRLVIRAVFLLNGWGWQVKAGNSAVLVWDKSVWQVVKRGHFLGHGYLKGVSNARYVPWVLLRNKKTKELLFVLGIHPCPIPTKKAPHMVPQAHVFQRRYFQRVADFIAARPNVPVVLLGDWNDDDEGKGAPLRTEIDGRKVNYTGKGIIRIATVDSEKKKWKQTDGRVVIDQPFSDHPIIRSVKETELAA